MPYNMAAITEFDKITGIVKVEDFEIKDCPFCGALPIFMCRAYDSIGEDNDQISMGFIYCSECNIGQSVIEDAKICIEKWNNRTTNNV